MSVSAIVVAGGSGTRMGRPKQFLPLAGKPMVRWSLDAFGSLEEVTEIVVVAPSQDHPLVLSLSKHLVGPSTGSGRTVVCAEPGPTRLASVRNGFAASSGRLVAVHDGARPLVDGDLIRRCLAEAERHGAAVAASPVVDTLKEAEEGWVAATPDRSRFWAAQTPQCYRRELLEKALEAFGSVEDATDESQLVERLGHRVRLVESSRENLKVTSPSDLVAAEALLGSRIGARATARAGFGFDIHRLVEGRRLMLAGVEVPHTKGLLGHSDGDVVLHAVCDALLGAAGLGEIGLLFPPGDPSTSGIASSEIARKVAAMLREKGASIVNIDAAIVAEEPKLKPHYGRFAASLASLFELPATRVNVKAKSHEGLGEIGQGLAIACHAVASVSL